MTKSRIFYFGFCLILLVLIVWRYQVVSSNLKNKELSSLNDSEQEVVLIGTVVKEPDVRETNTKLTIEVRPPLSSGGRTSAKLLVTVSRYPEYQYGDELKITGKLQTPIIFEDFNYKNYLAKDGITSVIYYPEIEIINRGRASVIFIIKNKLREVIYENLSPPQSSILGAMILGDKNRMSYDLKEKLNIAGVRHITAVSGLHIFILSTILMSLLIFLGLWKKQAFYFSLIIIWLFIIMTGFQSSGIRAGIMGTFFILGQGIGRKSVSSRAIVIAAGVMLVINPLLLFYDAGFQLSFLAALGIISLAPFLKKWVRSNILAMSLAAYIFTLPILIHNFGRISLVAPLTNILVIPVVYPIMILGFVFSLIGLIWFDLAWVLSWPVWFLLTYIIKIVDFFSAPWAAATIKNISWSWLIVYYLILGLLTWQLRKREKLFS